MGDSDNLNIVKAFAEDNRIRIAGEDGTLRIHAGSVDTGSDGR